MGQVDRVHSLLLPHDVNPARCEHRAQPKSTRPVARDFVLRRLGGISTHRCPISEQGKPSAKASNVSRVARIAKPAPLARRTRPVRSVRRRSRPAVGLVVVCIVVPLLKEGALWPSLWHVVATQEIPARRQKILVKLQKVSVVAAWMGA
jgi:hypothetical protein